MVQDYKSVRWKSSLVQSLAKSWILSRRYIVLKAHGQAQVYQRQDYVNARLKDSKLALWCLARRKGGVSLQQYPSFAMEGREGPTRAVLAVCGALIRRDGTCPRGSHSFLAETWPLQWSVVQAALVPVPVNQQMLDLTALEKEKKRLRIWSQLKFFFPSPQSEWCPA